MKSFLFSTEDDRGGVMLCDIETLEDAVVYLGKRFNGVIRVEQGKDVWTTDGGFVFVDKPHAVAESAEDTEVLTT
ncbi:hypothetical protein [Neptunomonas japonica]|uniref:Uncharacterized protein n=1 Tax=Neptunomonas japonica JAMM 1380 TaxID=1441457 RepID=A0A7R6SV51_9GAMM|nr:hypothetical protein [Neptunomonas japonica]BBB29065.1 conserved hypothetical protein [Neptunomonas japonica JAMM 1380]